MTTIVAFQKNLSNVSKTAKKNVAITLNSYGKQLLEDFRKRSAVDTGKYRRSWRYVKANPSNEVISLSLKNATSYAKYLIDGMELGSAPWFFPKGKSKKEATSPSGKLVVGQPRGAFGWWLKGSKRAVWAGGLSPGKSTAVGGVRAGLLLDSTFQKELIDAVSDAMVKGL